MAYRPSIPNLLSRLNSVSMAHASIVKESRVSFVMNWVKLSRRSNLRWRGSNSHPQFSQNRCSS